ncbi:murein hydrolase activator EnvC family protein [Trichlorobacter ammonificans]|uniref:Septal ring factor EnvC, activator of murein hydrolases AmiA and AmiB n=1 Tax=Trichlorobacter ammonificans TaxID=2916410 RepID=A0ABM9D737_9BACT|nr:peptidoglycan DD-metalloendopeptidase family protein [Trichlorobacter ammonificans]CAH2031018.1 Septal ring factor EnvC, activator of murein hydrolases AmiA and AmiB [Trichlorobacter ammonificans]
MLISRRLILVLWCLALLAPVASVANTPHEELRSVKREIRKKQSQINTSRKVEAAVSSELQEISRTLSRKEAELKQLDRELSDVEGGIHRTEQEIGRVTEEAQVRQRQIERRLVSLYKAGELGALRLFFSADSFPQMAENVRYMGSILENDKRVFQEYHKKIEELGQLKKRLEADASRKERIKDNIALKKREIEAEKSRKASHLSTVRQDRQAHEASLRTLQANAARLQSMLERLEAQSRRRAAQRQDRTGVQKGKPLPELPPVPDRGFASQKGRMRMPVNGEVIETYGKHKHPEFNSFTFSKGLLIAASLGSDIRSIYDGSVIFADYFKGYGNMVIIDHGGGYFSLYAHASKISRKVGAEVNRGDVIGSVGDVDSTRGAVLYFEIRHQGKPVDPAGWVR